METERLLLRKYKLAEKKHLIKLFTDEKVMKRVGDGVLTVKKAEDIFNKLIGELYPKGIETIYGVFSRKDQTFIGHAAIRPRQSEENQWEIGYILKSEEWGKGYATEIAGKLVEFGFNEMQLKNVFATVDTDNFASIRILEKIGMKYLNDEYDEKGKFYLYGIQR